VREHAIVDPRPAAHDSLWSRIGEARRKRGSRRRVPDAHLAGAEQLVASLGELACDLHTNEDRLRALLSAHGRTEGHVLRAKRYLAVHHAARDQRGQHCNPRAHL